MNILFASSEAHPLIKTGGLADVSGSLPHEIKKLKQEIRLVLPAYPAAVRAAGDLAPAATLRTPGFSQPVRILEGRLPGADLRLYLVDAPALYDRPGGPYSQPDGKDWPDNAMRFGVFCRAVTELALGRAGLDWRPDLVHCNDWQSALVPALLADATDRPASLFTIHNLAYQGLFSRADFDALQLPRAWWAMDRMEFYGNFSFIKGGLIYADWLNTVSPSYAREICTPEYGCGLDTLLASRSGTLSGILNGVDYDVWSPERDAFLPKHYSAKTIKGKQISKAALQKAFKLPVNPDAVVLGHVGRLVEQKGVDLILRAIPQLLHKPIQLVLLGTGQPELETVADTASRAYPNQIGARIGYDEALSHLLEAGSDIFLMPSRFEPCGLNQLYSLRYGTPPIVRRTGGLGDSVVDAADDGGTGFVFTDVTAPALLETIERALALHQDPAAWAKLVRNGMRQDFSWRRSAKEYLALYRQAVARRAKSAGA